MILNIKSKNYNFTHELFFLEKKKIEICGNL